MILWITGLPCSGKTTIAEKLARKLDVELLDGDALRNSPFSQGIGFSKEEREQHLLRVGYLAKRLSKHKDVVCSFVSPFEETRQKLPIDILVYLKCPAEVCEQRDVKGMYKKARNGQIANFTGVDAPYEEPLAPSITLDTSVLTINECVQKILDMIPVVDYCI